MNIFYVGAFCFVFVAAGGFIFIQGLSSLLRSKRNNIVTAKRIGLAKERIPDATDDEILYEYFVKAEPYYLIVTPGDRVEDYVGVSYDPNNPEDGQIYYKEDSGAGLQLCIFGFIFAAVGLLFFALVATAM